MNILIIAPEAYPPTTGESIVTTKLIAGLIDAGHTVYVIRHASSAIDYPLEESREFSYVEGSLIDLHDDKETRKGTVSWVFKVFSKALELIKEQKIDLVYSRIMPIYGHLPALLISLRCSIPWVANWSDPAPLVISPRPYKKELTLKDKIIFRLLRSVAAKADWRTFPSKYLEKYMLNVYREMKGKSSVIPHIAHSSLFRTPKYNNDIFKIYHIGGLGIRNPDTFIQAVSRFIKSRAVADIEILFIGPIDADAMKLVDSYKLSHVITSVPPVSYQESLKYLDECDVSLVIEADLEEGIFFPSKVLDIIQFGKPIFAISPKKGVMNDLLHTRAGIAANRNNVQEIGDHLELLYNAWKNGTLDSTYGSAVLRQQFHESTVVNELCRIQNTIALKKGR